MIQIETTSQNKVPNITFKDVSYSWPGKFENVINNCVNSFAELKNLILGETVDQQIVEDLYVMLSPAAASLETLEYFNPKEEEETASTPPDPVAAE